MPDAPLFFVRNGPIGELVLNRPHKRNALTRAMWQTLPRLLDEAMAEPDLRVLIVRGEGGAFAAGADIGEFEDVYATPESADAFSAEVATALDALASFPLPTLAQIDGACIGAGCGIALACDIRYASAEAKFGITPAKLGLLYPLNDTRRLVDAVGQSIARDILFSARHLDAREAAATGLINACLPATDLEVRTREMARLIASRSRDSLRGLKSILDLIADGVHNDTAETRALFRQAFDSDDFSEGYRAFLEKRPPDFSGPDKDKT
ncbi:enoyl-CoA hydratase-related protein [Hyphobacterium sp.]|uniref:enoyl-CoA hydratase-related protein n=1 Tax=Hyphobacterium sp. TaxID=2004662 RepID=UPI003749FE12